MNSQYYQQPYKGGVKEVRMGFSLPAFIFSFLWAVVKGIWSIAIADLLFRAFLLIAI